MLKAKFIYSNNITPAIIRAVFFAGIFLLASISYFTYTKNKELIIQSENVNHTNIVKLSVLQNLTNLTDAETGYRGFLLTKDSVFLEPYLNALKKIPITLNKIDSLTSNNKNQNIVYDTLKLISNKRIALIKSFEKNYENISQNQILINGKKEMDALRATTNRMIIEEDRLLKLRTESLTKALSITPLITILLSILAMAVLSFPYFKILYDLKKSKDLQEQLAMSEKVLINSNTELMQFAFVASHDLQEPLRKIQTFISRIAETETTISAKGLDYFGRIDKSAKKMQQLILDILSYSRLNNQVQKTENLDLNNVAYAAKYQLEDVIQQKNATLHINHLPSVHVIKYQMEQVFTNLIGNALKFTKLNEAPVITITANIKTSDQINHPLKHQEQSYHCISVSDNGIGFDEEHGEKIFNIFNRLHAKEAYEGNGIGLSIVKKIVEAHGGFIIAKSAVNEGATFEIYLPL